MSPGRHALRSTVWRWYGRASHLRDTYLPIIDLAGGPDAAVLVAGSARSGTTWVGSVLASMNGARQLFEPLVVNSRRELAVPLGRRLREGDLARNVQLYIRPDAGEQTPYFEPIRRILAGQVGGKWCDSQTRPGWYRSRVVKDIRANLSMAWMRRVWPGLRIVWVLRHPLAVVHSQLEHTRQRGSFDWSPDDVLQQPDLVADWLAPYVGRMTPTRELWQRLAHRWCIETLVPRLQRVHDGERVVQVRYEDLVSGTAAWRAVEQLTAEKAWSPATFERLLHTPSSTTLEPRMNDTGVYPLLTPAAQRGVMEIVDAYGLSDLYPRPCH